MIRFIAFVGLVALSVLSAHAEPDESRPSNNVKVHKPPVAKYPPMANFFGMTARCDVRFDLLRYGQVKQITSVHCSNLMFCAAASNAVQTAELEVVDVDGAKRPGERKNLVYPMDFAFRDAEDIGHPVLQECPVREEAIG